jgi:hypothetical protein
VVEKGKKRRRRVVILGAFRLPSGEADGTGCPELVYGQPKLYEQVKGPKETRKDSLNREKGWQG